MKTLMAVIVSLVLLTCFENCKRDDDFSVSSPPVLDTPETPADSNILAYFRGRWRADSIVYSNGKRTDSHLMDTANGLNPTTTSRINFDLADDTSFYANPGYHWGMRGTYNILSSKRINFQVFLLPDLAPRPWRVWDSVLVDAFNKVETYRMDGDGPAGNQLTLNFSNKQAAIKCTKH